jgi:hypothetical protein
MFDVAIPNNNEDEFIDVALALGYSELVFLTKNPKYDYKSDRIIIKKAYLVKNTNEILKVKKSFDYVFAYADRKFFESKVDFIINAEQHPSRDSFHYRKTSLNQVHAKLCKENNITLVFGFTNLLTIKYFSSLQTVLGRMMQNAVLVNKYKITNICFSMANEPMLMRSRTLLDTFSKMLGIV